MSGAGMSERAGPPRAAKWFLATQALRKAACPLLFFRYRVFQALNTTRMGDMRQLAFDKALGS